MQQLLSMMPAIIRRERLIDLKQSLREPRFRFMLMAAILTCGAVLRMTVYLPDRSFWYDEAALALNVTDRSFDGLFTPLKHDQAAPPGFLVLVKGLTEFCGNDEHIWRLLPLIASLLSLALVAHLARSFLTWGASTVAVALFAFAPGAIVYTAEFKPYSLDALVAVLLTILALPLFRRDITARSSAPLALTGCVTIWFSFPSVFVMGGLGLALFAQRATRHSWNEVKFLAGIASMWLASFAGLYFLMLRGTESNEFLLTYWAGAFAPLPPTSIDDLKWYINAYSILFRNPIGPATSEGGLSAGLEFSCLVGVVYLARRSPWILTGLLLPLGLALMASMVGRYPFSGRLLLFTSPTVILITAAGVWRIIRKVMAGDPLMLLITLLLGAGVIKVALSATTHPPHVEQIVRILDAVADRKKEGDKLYVYYGALPAWRYYNARCPFTIDDTMIGKEFRKNWKEYLAELDGLRGKGRVWIVFAHAHGDEKRLFLAYLDRIGNREDEVQQNGASAFLYDLPDSFDGLALLTQ